MTVSNTTSTVTGYGNGVNTLWNYTFEIPDANSVVVTLVDPSGVETPISAANYSITGLGTPGGGAVTYPLVGSPIATGYAIRTDRVSQLTQNASFSSQRGNINPIIEAAVDKLTFIAQEVRRDTSKAIAAVAAIASSVAAAAASAAAAATYASDALASAGAAAASAAAAALFDPSNFYTKVQADARYYTQSVIDTALALLAPKANPTFTGTVTITTAANTDISAKAASTAFVKDAGGWDFIAEDQKTSGTGGGTSVVGVQTRTLNTVVVNKLGATLSSNVVTLVPGTYYIEADAAAYAGNATVLKLVNNTGGALLQIGKGEYSGSSVQTRATLIASALTLAVSTGIRLDHYIAFAQTNGLGSPHSQGTEIYAQIKIRRLA